ncbi:hypothetical protein MUK42_13391 [Musa troglodytarum]|uniref:Uncharacterized protein n=1 Tax=Musa troglodytarum TaxID=320322 RepID=A0A9E7GL58_9LILI|nr:hypothetical protein MUK42_13391 [Musa troglodytarum]
MGVLRHRRCLLSAAVVFFVLAAALGSGRHRAEAFGKRELGSSEATSRPWVVAAYLPGSLRPVLPLPAGSRGDPAGPKCSARVLPGGMAMQVRQQALHAMRAAEERKHTVLTVNATGDAFLYHLHKS